MTKKLDIISKYLPYSIYDMQLVNSPNLEELKKRSVITLQGAYQKIW